MEEVNRANKRLKTARDNYARHIEAQVTNLDKEESDLVKQLTELDRERFELAEVHGNAAAAADDLIEINAGGEIVAAKRSTLTQLQGTRLETVFSGRWEKKLPRDSSGRIFLDMNPICFRAIVDYLNEVAISSEDNRPSLPSVAAEHEHILRQQLDLFGLTDMSSMPESNIIKSSAESNILHRWLEEDGSDGNFDLLYSSSRDGFSFAGVHPKFLREGCTLCIIETTDGFVLGGFSNTPWTGTCGYCNANKAFLFLLSGRDVPSPSKAKLKDGNNFDAIYSNQVYGPAFGSGHDLKVDGQSVFLNTGYSYQALPSVKLTKKTTKKYAEHTIKEIEVFRVTEDSPLKREHSPLTEDEEVKNLLEHVNEALKYKQKSLVRLKSEIARLQESLNDERQFISAFASGGTGDIVTLNVSGTTMTTERSTLCIATDSVLAQQFDDSKWTEQGCNNLRVHKWTSSDVCTWAESIDGVSDDVSILFKDHEITGRSLLALDIHGLKMMGIQKVGTMYLLSEEIKKLQNVTLIEHSSYCFGKILDYLRLKNFYSRRLVKEPALPVVCDSQKTRFEKVVKYYFPGKCAKFILG